MIKTMTTVEALLDLKTTDEVYVMKSELKKHSLSYFEEVEITQGYTDHGFEIGERVHIIDIDDFGKFRAISLDQQYFNYVLAGEFKKTNR